MREMATLQEKLAHVLWIGGSPCSGKSSVSRLLADRYGLQVYECDALYEDHLASAVENRHPRLVRARNVSWDEVWNRPLSRLVCDEFAFYEEEFELILDDLLAMPSSRPILAEGTALVPRLVIDLLPNRHQAIWIVPTEEFQHRMYPARGEWVQEILRQYRDPQQCFANWMARDVEFARIVAGEARQYGLSCLTVDGSESVESFAGQVEHHLMMSGILP